MTKAKPNKRRFTRFTPDPGSFALIDPNGKGEVFSPEISALMVDEAYAGCALVLSPTKKIKKDSIIWVRAGKLKAMRAVVRWCRHHSEKIMEIGIEYAE